MIRYRLDSVLWSFECSQNGMVACSHGHIRAASPTGSARSVCKQIICLSQLPSSRLRMVSLWIIVAICGVLVSAVPVPPLPLVHVAKCVRCADRCKQITGDGSESVPCSNARGRRGGFPGSLCSLPTFALSLILIVFGWCSKL